MPTPDVTTPTIDYWALAGRVSVVVAIASSAIVAFFGRAILRAVFVAGMRLAADSVEKFIRELFKERITSVDAAVQKVGELEAGLDDLEKTMVQHTTHLVESFKQELTRQTQSIEAIAENTTDALKSVAKSVEELAKQQGETSREVANIAGYLRASSGEGFSSLDRRSSGAPR